MSRVNELMGDGTQRGPAMPVKDPAELHRQRVEVELRRIAEASEQTAAVLNLAWTYVRIVALLNLLLVVLVAALAASGLM